MQRDIYLRTHNLLKLRIGYLELQSSLRSSRGIAAAAILIVGTISEISIMKDICVPPNYIPNIL
jgi:hypothetical protein